MDDDVLMEVVSIGNAVQVRAIRASTGREIAFTAPGNTSRRDLEALALNKLIYVEQRDKAARLDPETGQGGKRKGPDQRPGPKGIIV
jgi:hypothetical protein